MCYTCILARVRAPHRGVHGHLEKWPCRCKSHTFEQNRAQKRAKTRVQKRPPFHTLHRAHLKQQPDHNFKRKQLALWYQLSLCRPGGGVTKDRLASCLETFVEVPMDLIHSRLDVRASQSLHSPEERLKQANPCLSRLRLRGSGEEPIH